MQSKPEWVHERCDRRPAGGGRLPAGRQRGAGRGRLEQRAAGDVVAIHAHRRAAVAWAMLGVMKSGAALTLVVGLIVLVNWVVAK